MQTEHKLKVCQRAMERSILNIKRKDKIRCADIRKSTNVIDVLKHCKTQKWKWARHITRMKKQKWTKKCHFTIMFNIHFWT